MNVANLQTLLRSQAAFLADAGAAAKLVADFHASAEGLMPFAAMKLDELVVLLRQADEYRTTGILPAKAPTRKPKAPAPSAAEKIDAATRSLRDLYDRATASDFDPDTINTALAPIAKLTVPQLKDVARGFEIANIPSKKADLLAALLRKIEERREMHQRTNVGPQ